MQMKSDLGCIEDYPMRSDITIFAWRIARGARSARAE
jgi:hypothetical protein